MIDGCGDSNEEASLDEWSREFHLTGLIDFFFRKFETAIQNKKKEKLRQSNIKDACDKEVIARVHQYIDHFLYQVNLSLNIVKLERFQYMLVVVGTFGRNLKAPSYHDIRVTLLNKELTQIKKLLKGQQDRWGRFGCSIMFGGWTDIKDRSTINFLVNYSTRTVFIKYIDVSDIVKT